MLKTSEAHQILSFNEAIRQKVALELSPSVPIPFRQKAALSYRAFYYHLSPTKVRMAFEVYPPNWLATIAAADGALLDLELHEPPYYGLPVKANEAFATHQFKYHYTLDEVEQKNDEMYALIDKLIPQWEAGTPIDGHEAREFLTLFKELAPAPLWPCYKKLSDFYHWVEL